MDDIGLISDAIRQPPEIIRIPPPLNPPLGYVKGSLIIGLSVCAVMIIPIVIASGQSESLLGVAVVLVFFASACGIGLRLAGKKYRHKYAAFMAKHGRELVEVSEREAKSDWNYTVMGSPADLLRKILKRKPEPTDRARVVCTGFSEPPYVGDLRFEPRFITENDRRWERVGKYAVPLVLGPVMLLQILASPRRIFRDAVLVVMVFAFGFSLVSVLFGGVVEANYIRMAPGIVQFMKFSGKGTKAQIRTYKMVAGTTVTVRDQWGMCSFVFGRDGQVDTLQLTGIRNRAEVTSDIWNAILSIAPIPDLPDDELLG